MSPQLQDATGTANDLTIGQGYNPASQIISQTRSNDSYSWTGHVNVDRNYTVNGLNQYSAAGSASFCHDANGNLTADGSSVYKYDIENRLVEKRVQTSDTCPTNTSGYTGTLQASLTYDPMGRLWQVTGPTTNTRFLYDGDELVAEYDSAGTLARRYVHSDNADDPVVQYDGAAVGASARTFLMPDERGSIAGLFTNDGSSLAKNSYDEYGIPGAANQGRFQYTGQIWIPELGMYYYKARLYSPTLGRFLQVDPIGYDDGLNIYAYVGNDPVNGVDPKGTQAVQAARAAAGECTKQPVCTSAVSKIAQGVGKLLVRAAAKAGVTKEETKTGVLYRALTPRDAATIQKGGGNVATDPKAAITPDRHVAGEKPSQYISTTKNLGVAERYAGENGIAVVDSSKIPSKTDISHGSWSMSLQSNYKAMRDAEVLATGVIPPTAIIAIIPSEE